MPHFVYRNIGESVIESNIVTALHYLLPLQRYVTEVRQHDVKIAAAFVFSQNVYWSATKKTETDMSVI